MRTFPFLVSLLTLLAPATQAQELYRSDFSQTAYGGIPEGWRDLIDARPSRNWIVDGNSFLRAVLKQRTGLLVYDGQTLADARVEAEFKMTEDENVSFGLVGRVLDRDHFYLARFSGAGRLELIKVKAGQEIALDVVKPVEGFAPRAAGLVALRRYREGSKWKLALTLKGDSVSAVVYDTEGIEQARLGAIDGEFKQGRAGLRCTNFAAASSFRIESNQPAAAKAKAGDSSNYTVARPFWEVEQLNTAPESLAAAYDVVIAGAGTGGWAAAMQASRMGVKVLLLEETDWIGGQMACAGVTTMDEDSVWMKFPVRERGLYREFHESMVAYYQTLEKDPFAAYFSYPDQLEGGYEPKAARAVLYGFIREARNRGAVLDVCVRTRVVEVAKQGDAVTGVTLETPAGPREVDCQVLIDATEYGDVIPLTGARYRAGNATSDQPNPAALVQDHTWTAIVREYPNGVPEHLRIQTPPPGYETGSGKRYRNYTNDGFMIWGAAGKGMKGRRNWRVFFAWRGMADADSPLTGERSRLRHTQCGFNGGNDYPVTAATLEDPVQRAKDEREGIYKTLGALYYFQHELGLNWSLAEDEGYATPYNRAKMKALDLRPDLEALAVHLPQQPYVRECRRIMGVGTLKAADLTRFEEAKHVTSSVAMGDYFMDLDHGKTAHEIETDLDAVEPPRGGGPFQIPFEVFIPEKIDGFLPAEKNISQSRLANGATRLQPVTMLTGQAAGAIAALAVKQNVQPRRLDPMRVQYALLESGSTLIQRWYADVPWGTPIWRATQLLSLHGILDRPGEIECDNAIALGSTKVWGVDKPLTEAEWHQFLNRVGDLLSVHFTIVHPAGDGPVTLAHIRDVLGVVDHESWTATLDRTKVADPKAIRAGEFALLVAELLKF